MNQLRKYITHYLPISKDILLVTVCSAVLLSCKEYFGKASIFRPWLYKSTYSWQYQWASYLFDGELSSLHSLLFWAFSCVLLYLLVPMLIRKWLFPNAASLFQFRLPASHWKIYAGMLLFMLLPLFAASFLPSFQQTYPFVYIPKGHQFAEILFYWEIGYFCQFIAVEYFFRGFLLFAFEESLGKAAVLVPIMPYVMIHFGKPFPETIGAIVAGLVLGTMALRSRSIVPGIFVHFSIAIGMDLLSLWQQGYFTNQP